MMDGCSIDADNLCRKKSNRFIHYRQNAFTVSKKLHPIAMTLILSPKDVWPLQNSKINYQTFVLNDTIDLKYQIK
jgi:hypothetical protein